MIGKLWCATHGIDHGDGDGGGAKGEVAGCEALEGTAQMDGANTTGNRIGDNRQLAMSE